MNNPGKIVYDMLAFQYKPLERHMLSNPHMPKGLDKWYKKLSYIQKIRALDKYASISGL